MTRYMVSWVFQLVLVLVLVFAAKSRASTSKWDMAKTGNRLRWGISIVAVVQICDIIKEATSGYGLGPLYHIQWIGVYWIALAVYRRKYLRASPSNAAVTAQTPNR